jgi:hypothetical protein
MYQYFGPFGPYFLSSHSIGLSENLLDVNIKFRYTLIIIDHQIDEKHHIFAQNGIPACQSEDMDQMPCPLNRMFVILLQKFKM